MSQRCNPNLQNKRKFSSWRSSSPASYLCVVWPCRFLWILRPLRATFLRQFDMFLILCEWTCTRERIDSGAQVNISDVCRHWYEEEMVMCCLHPADRRNFDDALNLPGMVHAILPTGWDLYSVSHGEPCWWIDLPPCGTCAGCRKDSQVG